MEINAKLVKELREATGCGMMDCKKALAECEGDMEKAGEYLRKKGIASAAKKEGRATSQGIVGSYIHMGGKVGVLVEVACETDFVARTDAFQEFVHNVAMHIAAARPRGGVPRRGRRDAGREGKRDLRGPDARTGQARSHDRQDCCRQGG
jgi:elongation factor Ts